jgi:biotin carboxyl carrier protein
VAAAGEAVAATGAAAGPGDVVAPLGGVVQSVSVALGQTVNLGETVVVLEAMKMNTVLTAPRAGKVTRVVAKPGDPVEAGQVLVSIE